MLYIQEGFADVWKENLLEDLELGEVEFGSAGERTQRRRWRISQDDRTQKDGVGRKEYERIHLRI